MVPVVALIANSSGSAAAARATPVTYLSLIVVGVGSTAVGAIIDLTKAWGRRECALIFGA